jgi:hypothetical protein
VGGHGGFQFQAENISRHWTAAAGAAQAGRVQVARRPPCEGARRLSVLWTAHEWPVLLRQPPAFEPACANAKRTEASGDPHQGRVASRHRYTSADLTAGCPHRSAGCAAGARLGGGVIAASARRANQATVPKPSQPAPGMVNQKLTGAGGRLGLLGRLARRLVAPHRPALAAPCGRTAPNRVRAPSARCGNAPLPVSRCAHRRAPRRSGARRRPCDAGSSNR